LLDLGADIDAAYLGRTPLLCAIDRDQNATVRFLLDKGANVSYGDAHKNSPLHVACMGGLEDIIHMLLQHDKDAYLDPRNTLGYTPLHLACIDGHESIVRILLSNGATVNLTSKFGDDTPLSLACKGNYLAIAQLLLENGANANALKTEACRYSHRIAELLRRSGATRLED
jgi:ankyrin repeat protein